MDLGASRKGPLPGLLGCGPLSLTIDGKISPSFTHSAIAELRHLVFVNEWQRRIMASLELTHWRAIGMLTQLSAEGAAKLTACSVGYQDIWHLYVGHSFSMGIETFRLKANFANTLEPIYLRARARRVFPGRWRRIIQRNQPLR